MHGFVEQILHYLNRLHVGMPTAPIEGRAVWMESELAPVKSPSSDTQSIRH